VAKPIRKADKKRKAIREERMPLQKQNYVIIGIGLLVIIAGYLAMMEGSVEGFLPLVVAPILLVIGYCVIIPFAILYRKREKKGIEQPSEQATSEPTTTQASA
jgi:hypothetical protein